MDTTYIRVIGVVIDPVWGKHALPWMKTPLIRCTRNRLRKAVFEWVGNARMKCDLDELRGANSVVVYAEESRSCHMTRPTTHSFS